MFDWITPTIGIIKDINNNGIPVAFPRNYTGLLKTIVKELGINNWAWQIVGDNVVFHVKKEDLKILESRLYGN